MSPWYAFDCAHYMRIRYPWTRRLAGTGAKVTWLAEVPEEAPTAHAAARI